MLKSYEDFLGIEIEVEVVSTNSTRRLPRVQGWLKKSDGSLRNGVEYVLEKPTKGKELYDAIRSFDRQLSSTNSLSLSPRCSTHVHCDIRDLSLDQLDKFVDLLLFFELDFINCNKTYDRSKSNFCWNTANTCVDTYLRHSGNVFKIESILGNKYSAINFKPISILGTIEIRCNEAQVKSGELLRTVNRILCLKKLSKSTKSRWDLLEWVANTSPRKIFGSSFRKGFKFSNSLENYARVISLREGV